MDVMDISAETPIGTLVEIALRSEEFMEAVKSVEKKVEKMRVQIRPGASRIEFESDEKRFFWNFFYPVEPSGQKATLTLGSQTFNCVKDDSGLYSGSENLEQALPAVIEFFLQLFDFSQCELSLLHIDIAAINDVRRMCSVLKPLTNVRHVAIVKSGEPTAPKLSTLAIIEWILMHVRMAGIRIGCAIDRDAYSTTDINRVRDMLLTRPHVYMDNCDWLTPSDISRFYAKTVMIGQKNKYTPFNLNTLIRSWINGEHSNMWWFNVKMNKHYSMDEVMLNVPHNEPVLPPKYCSCPFRLLNDEPAPFYFLSNARQVRRADGTTAVVCVSASQFFFHVKSEGPTEPELTPETRRLHEVLDLLSQIRDITGPSGGSLGDDAREKILGPNRLKTSPEELKEILEKLKLDRAQAVLNFEASRLRSQLDVVERRVTVLQSDLAGFRADLDQAQAAAVVNGREMLLNELRIRIVNTEQSIEMLRREQGALQEMLRNRQRQPDAAAVAAAMAADPFAARPNNVMRRYEALMQRRAELYQQRQQARQQAQQQQEQQREPAALFGGLGAMVPGAGGRNGRDGEQVLGELLRAHARHLHANNALMGGDVPFLEVFGDMHQIEALLRRREQQHGPRNAHEPMQVEEAGAEHDEPMHDELEPPNDVVEMNVVAVAAAADETGESDMEADVVVVAAAAAEIRRDDDAAADMDE